MHCRFELLAYEATNIGIYMYNAILYEYVKDIHVYCCIHHICIPYPYTHIHIVYIFKVYIIAFMLYIYTS